MSVTHFVRICEAEALPSILIRPNLEARREPQAVHMRERRAHLVSSPVSAGCPSKLRLRRCGVGAVLGLALCCAFHRRCCCRRVRAACMALRVAATACAPPRLWRAPLLRFTFFLSSYAVLLFTVATGSPPHSGQHEASLCVACTGAGGTGSDLYAEELSIAQRTDFPPSIHLCTFYILYSIHVLSTVRFHIVCVLLRLQACELVDERAARELRLALVELAHTFPIRGRSC